MFTQLHIQVTRAPNLGLKNPVPMCNRGLGNARIIDEGPIRELLVGDDNLEVVLEFCYLSDMLPDENGCELAANFRQLLLTQERVH